MKRQQAHRYEPVENLSACLALISGGVLALIVSAALWLLAGAS